MAFLEQSWGGANHCKLAKMVRFRPGNCIIEVVLLVRWTHDWLQYIYVYTCPIRHALYSNSWDLRSVESSRSTQFPGWLGDICRVGPATWLIGFFGTAILSPLCTSAPPARSWPVAVAAGWLAGLLPVEAEATQPRSFDKQRPLPFTSGWHCDGTCDRSSLFVFLPVKLCCCWDLGLGRTIDSDCNADVVTETKAGGYCKQVPSFMCKLEW